MNKEISRNLSPDRMRTQSTKLFRLIVNLPCCWRKNVSPANAAITPKRIKGLTVGSQHSTRPVHYSRIHRVKQIKKINKMVSLPFTF